jgi:hypothetical protein
MGRHNNQEMARCLMQINFLIDNKLLLQTYMIFNGRIPSGPTFQGAKLYVASMLHRDELRDVFVTSLAPCYIMSNVRLDEILRLVD